MDRKLSGSDIFALIESQEYRCALSGMELTPATASLDHKQPVSRGGAHDISNAQIVHCEVNRMKGVLTMDEFIRMCCRVTQWNESRIDTIDPILTPQRINET
jgi:hypothetical protein